MATKEVICTKKQKYGEGTKNQQILIFLLSQIMGYHSEESTSHVQHIRTLTEILLKKLPEITDQYTLSAEECEQISIAAALHDIGKVGVDLKILNKPGKLSHAEFEVVKQHTLMGASLIEKAGNYQESGLIKVAYEICRWHHERYDGRGYPDGLVGDEIPISAQIVALADVYDALVSKRVYKPMYSHDQAIQMILQGECGIFNPLLLRLLECPEVADQMKEVAHESYRLLA